MVQYRRRYGAEKTPVFTLPPAAYELLSEYCLRARKTSLVAVQNRWRRFLPVSAGAFRQPEWYNRGATTE
jgi:hypothetical protein